MSSMQEIRVFPAGNDHEAEALRKHAASVLGIEGLEVGTCRVFYAEGIEPADTQRLASELFATPIVETSEVGPRTNWTDGHRPEVALQPGATNTAARSIIQAAANLGVNIAAADTGVEYRFSDEMSTDDIARIMKDRVNTTVERIRTEAPVTLQITGEVGPVETIDVIGLNEKELDEVSKKLELVLDTTEMLVIQDYFTFEEKRNPTDCELQLIAGRWSDHCCHKTFNAKIFVDGQEEDPLFKQIKDTAREQFDDEILSAFDDNSGVFMFYDGMAICIKLETHNGPLNIEPYGGAATGTGGVIRDIIGTGLVAKPILSIDIWLFAPLDTPREQLPDDVLSPQHMHDLGIKGVQDYGNRMGIPTANGSAHFDPDFRGKAGVLVGSLGIMPVEAAKKREPTVGDLVVAVGAPTGRDGIHGATMASGEMTSQTAEIHSGAVQIGDAIAEKKMQDALLEASRAGLISAITDCGAAGFSSAIGEMAETTGVTIDLAKAPLKYQGLKPWEIWMSESQERMVAAVAPQDFDAFEAICNKHSTTTAALGVFDGSNRLKVNHGDTKVVNMSYSFLNQGPPQKQYTANWQPPQMTEVIPRIDDMEQTVIKVLSHGNVRSQEHIVRRYDHEVGGATVLKPYGGVHRDAPNDGVVLRPIPGKPYGLVTAHGLNPTITKLDPYHGTTWSIAEAMANFAAIGGDPSRAVWSNNYIYPKPTEQQFGATRLSVKAVCDGMRAFKRPVITGKDSMSMTYVGSSETIESPGTTAITVAGKIPDVINTITSDIKRPGSKLVLLGEADVAAMGGSVLYDVLGGQSANVPKVNLGQLPAILKGLYNAIQTGKVLACHDVSEGGLAVTLAEMSFGGDCGMDIELQGSVSAQHHMFNETAGQLVVEVPDEQTAHELFSGLPYRVIGTTKSDKVLTVRQDSVTHLNANLDVLKAAWKGQLEEAKRK